MNSMFPNCKKTQSFKENVNKRWRGGRKSYLAINPCNLVQDKTSSSTKQKNGRPFYVTKFVRITNALRAIVKSASQTHPRSNALNLPATFRLEREDETQRKKKKNGLKNVKNPGIY